MMDRRPSFGSTCDPQEPDPWERPVKLDMRAKERAGLWRHKSYS